jgi:hypothetical protein
MSIPHRVPGPPVDTSRPHPARRYDYWLGGKDNFAADRRSADRIATAFPGIRSATVENRRFLRRAVSYLAADRGISQFLDIGSGIPTHPAVHHIAQSIDPAARVVYADNDPLVMAHARALLTCVRPGRAAHLQADLRDPQTILTDPALHTTLDLDRPVGLLLVAVLHFLDDADYPYRCVGQLVDALPAGSVMVLSHATYDVLPADTVAQLTELTTTGGHGPFRPRTHAEVARFVNRLDLLNPGIVSTVNWRPDLHPTPDAASAEVATWAAVAARP